MKSERFTILFVDDDPAVISSLKRIFFEEENYRLLSANDGRTALLLMSRQRVDAALVDLKMPGMDGLALLQNITRDYPATRVIIITGHGGVEVAVRAMRNGAFDFLEKPFCPEVVRNRVAQLYETWFLQAENQFLRQSKGAEFSFSELVGDSPPMRELKEMIVKIAPGEASVLVGGETGTGKELVARALHQHSDRAARPFVPIDCAALNENVIESELFGHCRGAFTGALNERVGLFRAAHQGTLFLDEVGELSLAMQVKLLRTIQERQVRPLGGQQSLPVDVRIIAATNRDLREEVAAGRFREDLYYRLQVFTLQVPPLRQRLDDLPALTTGFIRRFAAVNGSHKSVSSAAMQCLCRYAWPGNVRELENVVRRALTLSADEQLEPGDFPAYVNGSSLSFTPARSAATLDTLAAHERRALVNALEITAGNRRQAARLLGIGEATLYRKIKKYRL
ncbi:MAG: sigma-54-dependent Fis family transcriptional regulator [Deltaproteobacteria bacterium]|nr:sigma-54-dependent Fis family transcriptional regulator [Deltaproteobacteria bacterium]